MQQFVGRLTALDPEASESLRVIGYFDALVAGGAGVDALLRGAAVLSGTVAGAELHGKVSRRSPDGSPLDPDRVETRVPIRTGLGWSAWLEREGTAHANDEMIVERLALAVELIAVRRAHVSGLDVVIDETRPIGDRLAALARLRVEHGTRLRLIATNPADALPTRAPSTVVPTKYGMVRATLDVSGDVAVHSPMGLGTWETAVRAPASWDGAVIALRLAETAMPVVDATDLGALLVVARAYDPATPPPDVIALARLDARSARILRLLVESESIRSAAAQLGMHHSSLQARNEVLAAQLGYDARTILGRVRYTTAELLRRLTDPALLQTAR